MNIDRYEGGSRILIIGRDGGSLGTETRERMAKESRGAFRLLEMLVLVS